MSILKITTRERKNMEPKMEKSPKVETKKSNYLDTLKDKLSKLKFIIAASVALFLSLDNLSTKDTAPGTVSLDGKFYRMTHDESARINKLTHELDSLITLHDNSNFKWETEDHNTSFAVSDHHTETSLVYTKGQSNGEDYSVFSKTENDYRAVKSSPNDTVRADKTRFIVFNSSNPSQNMIIDWEVKDTPDPETNLSTGVTKTNLNSSLSGQTLISYMEEMKSTLEK